MFRAIAHQTPEGQENHMALRGAAVHEVQAKITEYTGFFATAQERRTWLASMPRNGFFADNYALMALVDVLRRPVLVWRTKAPSQVPTVFLPSSGISEERLLMPIYLLLDESKRGCEHYTALIPSAAPVRAVKQEVKREAAAAEAVQERRAESSAAPPLTVGQVWDLTAEDGKVFAAPLLDLAKKEEELTPTEPDDEEEKLPATVPDEEEFEIRDERVFMKITTVLKAEAENLRSQQEPVLKRRRIRVKSAPPPSWRQEDAQVDVEPLKRRRLVGKKEDPVPVEESEHEAGVLVAWQQFLCSMIWQPPTRLTTAMCRQWQRQRSHHPSPIRRQAGGRHGQTSYAEAQAKETVSLVYEGAWACLPVACMISALSALALACPLTRSLPANRKDNLRQP